MEYNKLIAEMSLSDEVEGFYVLKAAYPKELSLHRVFRDQTELREGKLALFGEVMQERAGK